jgi:hypothetical protein
MPLKLTRPPSNELGLVRRLSIEEKYNIAETAKRKSGSEATRRDLRLAVGHSHMLDMLLKDIAKEEYEQALKTPPRSPPARHSGVHITWADNTTGHEEEPAFEHVEEYDDGAEDLESLSLCRTQTRKR